MPNLIDYLTFRARLAPSEIAIQTAKTTITWRRTLRLVQGIARRLRDDGLQPGQVVITALRNPEIDWLVTLALFHEAAISCSAQNIDTLPETLKVDLLITDRASVELPGSKTLLIDSEWLVPDAKDAEPIEPRDYASGNANARLVLTSGTTGRSKAVALTIEQIIGRTDRSMAMRGAHTAICTLGLSTAAALNFACSCLVTGAPYLLAKTSGEIVDLARSQKVEGIMTAPAQLGGIVDLLEQQKEPLRDVKIVRCGGGVVSKTLMQRVSANITDNVLVLYGSTEAFGMCAFKPTLTSDPAIVGYAAPNTRVEVVDAEGNVLPPGQRGLVRVKAPYMVSGYYGDEEQTARSFKEGWFYPGDRGVFAPGGLLVLAGRQGDMLNAGGVKIDPAPIDLFLAESPGVKDAAVFVRTNKSGVDKIAAAIVPGPDFDIDVLRTNLQKNFPKDAPTMVVKVKAIPRNAMGKVMRKALAESLSKD